MTNQEMLEKVEDVEYEMNVVNKDEGSTANEEV